MDTDFHKYRDIISISDAQKFYRNNLGEKAVATNKKQEKKVCSSYPEWLAFFSPYTFKAKGRRQTNE